MLAKHKLNAYVNEAMNGMRTHVYVHVHATCLHVDVVNYQLRTCSIWSNLDQYLFCLCVCYFSKQSLTHRRLACLKYLVLANMLMKSGINPFDSQEVRNMSLAK